MGVETGGPSGKDIEPYDSEESKEVRKEEPTVEKEDSEFLRWLEAISWSPDKVHFWADKISDPDISQKYKKFEDWHLKEAEAYHERAEVLPYGQKRNELEELADAMIGRGWLESAEVYFDSQADLLLERLSEQIKKQGDLSGEDREGLFLILTAHLAESLRKTIFYQFSAEDNFKRYPGWEIKKVYHEIKTLNTEPYTGKEERKQDFISALWGTPVYDTEYDIRNSAPFYAILTYERNQIPKDILNFAMIRLEKMGFLLQGGLKVDRGPNIGGMHNEEIIAGDCIIVAARLAKLLGNIEKQKELYKRGYNFFGHIGKVATDLENLTLITQKLISKAVPTLLLRIAECARGADLPEAELWERAYEKATGKKIRRKSLGKKTTSLPKREQKSLPRGEMPKELPDKFE